jgi:uncharacterized protein (DUF302 family)
MIARSLPFLWGLVLASIMINAFASNPAANAVEATGSVERGSTSKSFADVVLELEYAITEHNFRITGRNTIGKGLRERGYKDFPDVEVIHFCNLENAREVLLLDPGYVALMPCRITVHEEGGKTIVSLVLLPEAHPDPRVVAYAKRMNKVLREIHAYVLQE